MTSAVSGQVVRFHPKHYLGMVTGAKSVTVRWNEDIQLGPTLFVFGTDPNLRRLVGHVTFIETHPVSKLTPSAVRQAPGTDMCVFVDELRANYYPDMPSDALVDIVGVVVD